MTAIHPKAKPFYLPGKSEQAFLMLHGFTASPSEVYPTARLIHECSGCTISAILLPGHGTTPELLNHCSWVDWYEAVRNEAFKLMADYEQVYVGGLSMGALLSLYAALHIEGLHGVVAINAPIYNRSMLSTACAPIYRFIRPYYPKEDIRELEQLEEEGRFAYRVMPVKAFQSMMDLRRRITKEVNQLTIPALIIQGMMDESVHPRSGRFLYEKIKAGGSNLLELNESRHIATMGPEKDQIAQEIAAFFAGHY